MVTASHNPPGYNGLKAETLEGELSLPEKDVNLLTNSEEQFEKFLQEVEFRTLGDKTDVYVGRDARASSSGLAKLIVQALEKAGMRVLDLGQTTTPELFSLAEFLHSPSGP